MVDQEKIHRKAASGDVEERREVVSLLRDNFADLPDKEQAWKDLIRLTQDDRRGVLRCWHNIKCWLTADEESYVRQGAALALGIAFRHVPDKEQAWKDLIRLTADEDGNVRASVNHSLGRASIFKATEEGDFESELKSAIEFFERSSKEATYSNPSVKRYLAEAKSASEGSQNKETLLEAVETLADVLSKAQKLKAYMQYHDRAAYLISAMQYLPGVSLTWAL